MASLVDEVEVLKISDEENSPSVNEAILEDHAFINEFLPSASIETLSDSIVTVIIMRTVYAKIQLRVQYPKAYPNEIPIIEMSSPTLPMPLLRNKEKECGDKAKEFLGKAQFQIIFEHIYKFIHGNMFIPCWKEMKQISALCEGKGQLGVDEKEGVLQMRLTCGKYKQGLKLKVPYNYPEEGVIIEFTSSNFPVDIQIMFQSQADEIVRRCVAGFSPEQALQVTNPVPLPPKASGESNAKLTSGSLKSLKHDVNVLKQMSDLRAASVAHDSKKYFTQANAERREARKDLRKLAKAESEADKEEQKRLLEEEQNAMKELLKCKVSETAQLSLYPAARYLVDDYALKIPVEPCQACKKPILPINPDDEAVKNPKSDNRPMRTFCGHWLHWNCLNDWLTTPPFVRQCPICNRRIWHPDWPEDYKQLEKAWQSKEARKREMADVSNLL